MWPPTHCGDGINFLVRKLSEIILKISQEIIHKILELFGLWKFINVCAGKKYDKTIFLNFLYKLYLWEFLCRKVNEYASLRPFLYLDHFHIFDLFCKSTSLHLPIYFWLCTIRSQDLQKVEIQYDEVQFWSQ